MNTRHEHDTPSHTPSPLRAPSRGVLILPPEEAPLSFEFFLLFAFRRLSDGRGARPPLLAFSSRGSASVSSPLDSNSLFRKMMGPQNLTVAPPRACYLYDVPQIANRVAGAPMFNQLYNAVILHVPNITQAHARNLVTLLVSTHRARGGEIDDRVQGPEEGPASVRHEPAPGQAPHHPALAERARAERRRRGLQPGRDNNYFRVDGRLDDWTTPTSLT